MYRTKSLTDVNEKRQVTGNIIKAIEQSIPMVATKDVATIAAHHLADPDFTGKVVHAVMGPKNYTLREEFAKEVYAPIYNKQ